MTSKRMNFEGGRISIERVAGAITEYVLSIHLTQQELAELLGAVVNVRSLTTQAQRAQKRITQKEEKARKEATDRQISESLELGRALVRDHDRHHARGMPYGEILRQLVRDYGVSQQRAVSLITFARKQDRQGRDSQIISLSKAGTSKAEIARKVGCSKSTVTNVIAVHERRQLQLGGAK
ncbi:hypothetical protein [Thalassospira sp.]|uniref:hypothetical protein n=1 Tax=Thalassospira sp. TaxID=1912094 RepID=UPI0032F08551